MNKEDVYDYLEKHNIEHAIINHPPAFTVEDILSFAPLHPEAIAKNLFLRDDKKQHYYLLVVRCNTPVSIRDFQEKAGTRRLSFASETDLMKYLGLTKGSVTPFGVLNDDECRVQVYLDDTFQNEMIGIHPNDNSATVYLSTTDLFDIISQHGNSVSYIHF